MLLCCLPRWLLRVVPALPGLLLPAALLAAPAAPAVLTTDTVALVADSAIGTAFWPGHARWGAPEPRPSVCLPGTPDWHRGQNGSDGAGLVAKFGLGYWAISAVAVAFQVAMIVLVVMLNRRHFGAPRAVQAVPAE